ncbi:MAG TPA: dolichyl-phosphate beta-glucosyltransferase [Candidatus Limnocylindrales bacterium]|nr:dolichyl-phosphate beta-glucosyltransferase [Bryobacteraceae bacterium]HXJ12189.1 dolichyl-phosphate beta-glucosyltransferase [Candidatus Limnocylindrales bacterium]
MNRSLSIVIPAYDEEKRLPGTLERIKSYLQSGKWKFSEVLVVDDGSRDGTVRVAEDFRARVPSVRVLRNPGNQGKGYSVRHGMMKAKGEWTLFTDADLSTPIEELEKLWTAAQEARAQIAIGSRALNRSLIGVHQPFFRESAGKVFNLAARVVTGLPFWDTQCGFKLFETNAAREIFRRQRLEHFGFDVEVLFIARKLGYSTIEVPVRWNDMAGTKVGAVSGLAAFLDPLRVRLHQLRGKYR